MTVFATHIPEKELVSKIHKELSKSKSNKTQTIQLINGRKTLRHFTEKDIQMPNKYMKRFETSLAIREMQIKTTMKYYYTAMRMAKIKNSDNIKR